MFPKIRWRIAASFIAWIVVIMGSLLLFVNRPQCMADPVCIHRSIFVAAGVMVITAVIIATIVAERSARPLRELTLIAKRITHGELHAHLLPQTRDEVGNFTRAFNEMTEELSQKITRLSNSEQRLAAILNYMADGVLIIDRNGRVQLINPAAARLLDTNIADAQNRSYAEVVRHHQLIELCQQCQANNQEQLAAIEVGKDLFLQAVVTPFERASQESGTYLLILQDLTRIRRLETVRRDFISNISHELRTPLTSLRAVVETLQDGAVDDREVALRFLERAEVEVDTMTQMVEELLELSRIESGQVPLRLKATAVSNLLLAPVERLQGQANRAEVDLQLDIPARLPLVLADAERMERVVINLIHNAIKFSLPKTTIHISAEAMQDEVHIHIKDSGIGIPERDIPRVFERFYKTDQARTRGHGGTGLGLAISRHIVQAHNGRIWVKSKEGKGSTFTFTLPLVDNPPG